MNESGGGGGQEAGRPGKASAKPVRGLFCPRCSGTDLAVTHCRHPCPGVRVRYRRCAKCGCRVVTRETVVKWTYPKPA